MSKPHKATSAAEQSQTNLVDETKARRELARQMSRWDDLPVSQQDELVASMVRLWDAKSPIRITLSSKGEGVATYEMVGASPQAQWLRLQSEFASVTSEPVKARIGEIHNYLSAVGMGSDLHINAALTFIQSMEPRDQAEVMLLTQMYCTHDASIRALSQMGGSGFVPNTTALGNLAAKLLRVSQGQMETLAKMRRGGEQVVRHIHVDNRGGQAVIAENVHTPLRNFASEEQRHATGNTGESAALLGSDPFGDGVSIASCQGPEKMPDALWEASGAGRG
ncbi:MAG: hypothetical protein ABIT10_10445 [Alteraurantiacibacter sp.]